MLVRWSVSHYFLRLLDTSTKKAACNMFLCVSCPAVYCTVQLFPYFDLVDSNAGRLESVNFLFRERKIRIGERGKEEEEKEEE